MKNLFSSLLFTLIFSEGLFALNNKSSELEHIKKMRDILIAIRIPQQVCKDAAALETHLSTAGHALYDAELAELKIILKKPKIRDTVVERSKTCLSDCTCNVYMDLEDIFLKSQTKTLDIIKKQSISMTDKDFQNCQRKIALNCSSKNVKLLVEEAKKSKKEMEN